jgi:hypothetical protein
MFKMPDGNAASPSMTRPPGRSSPPSVNSWFPSRSRAAKLAFTPSNQGKNRHLHSAAAPSSEWAEQQLSPAGGTGRFVGRFNLQKLDAPRGHEPDRVWNVAFMRQQRSTTHRVGILLCRGGRSRCCRMNAAFLAPAASARFTGSLRLQLWTSIGAMNLPEFRVYAVGEDYAPPGPPEGGTLAGTAHG